MGNIIAGIDPGVKTGLEAWMPRARKFHEIKTVGIVEAVYELESYRSAGLLSEVRFEDARLRKWFPEKKHSPEAIARLQGVGSVKRDSTIWQDFCEYHEIPFHAVNPKDMYANFPLPPGCKKWDAKYFKKMTGWKGRTSKHSRDAAALVFGL